MCSRIKDSQEAHMDKLTDARQRAEDIFECRLEVGPAPAYEAEAVVSSDSFVIRPAGAKAIHLEPRHVSSLIIGASDIRIQTTMGLIRLFMLGRRFDRAAEVLSRWYERGKLADSLMPEKPEETFDEVQYELSRKSKRQGTVRLYSTFASVTDAKNGRVRRIPYSYIRDILDEGHSVNIRMLKGPDIALSMLGRRKDALIRRLYELRSGLSESLALVIGGMVGIDSGSGLKMLAECLPDGRGAILSAIEGKSPETAAALTGFLSSSRVGPLMGAADEIAVGAKKGLMGELDGDYLWIVARIGPIAVFDAVSEEQESSRAAYVFGCDGGGFPGFVEDLSWGLTSIGFRREPLYLSEEKLKAPGHESYLQALEDVAELKRLRQQLTARVIHTGEDSWVTRIMKMAGKVPEVE